MKEILKVIFLHDLFMHELCEACGNPEDVKNHLVKISTENPWISIFIKKDIENMDAELQKEAKVSAEQSAEIAWEKANYPCIDCCYGNGETHCHCGIALCERCN